MLLRTRKCRTGFGTGVAELVEGPKNFSHDFFPHAGGFTHFLHIWAQGPGGTPQPFCRAWLKRPRPIAPPRAGRGRARPRLGARCRVLGIRRRIAF
jgi:hypothetical protein